jgi:hypothetical protein
MARIDRIAKGQKFIGTAAADRYDRVAQCFSSDDPRIYSSAAPTGTRISSDDQRLYPPAAATTKPPKVAAAPPQRLTITPDDEGIKGIIRYTPGRPIIAIVKLNGRTTARLILDTGSDDTTIKPQILTAAGVDLEHPVGHQKFSGVGPGVHSAPLVYVDSIEVAGGRVQRLKVSAYNINNPDADGLLGRDFLDHFKMTTDPAAGTVTLVPR